MSASSCPVPTQPNLNYHLFHKSKCPDDLRHLIVDISRACRYISYEMQTTDAGLAGSQNEFGEEQLALDVVSDKLMHQFLCENNDVCCFASEENSDIVRLNDNGKFSVAFDPLDGSSLVETNFAIGTIVGIYQGDGFIGRTPREQVAALYVLYGPRTILVYSTGEGVHGFLLNDVGEFVLLEENYNIGPEAQNYSPGNLRMIHENEGYGKLMQQWLDEGKTLRYSGCMVADIHHIFVKGQGIFTNVGGGDGSKYPNGKLRLLYECGPFAYLIEQAGGASSTGEKSILDEEITDLAQRCPIIVGSEGEVARTTKVLRNA